MSKNTPRQRVEQFKDWLSWIMIVSKKKNKK